MNYFGEISKILKSKMAPIIPTIMDVVIKAIVSEDIGLVTKGREKE